MAGIGSALRVFRSRKMAALLLLGFSSGLPLFLTGRTLQAWMTVEGIDLTTIGLFSLVRLPYSLKFLWSPLLDSYTLPMLGRRRGWLLLTQLLLLVAIALMGLQNPRASLRLLAANALAIAFLSATQDIAVDAYRADVLEPLEIGAGAGIYVLGYRIALLITGSAALMLADQLPWPMVYGVMSLLMLVGMITTLWAPEPAVQPPAPTSLRQAVVQPFGDFFERYGWDTGPIILVFICLYRLGDTLTGNMMIPFLLQQGFSQTEIGAVQGGIGLAATLVGALAGGAAITQIGIHRALWIMGGLQASSNVSYFVLAHAGANPLVMIAAISIDNFCAGLAIAALTAFLMSLCNPQFSATQYALLSSLFAFSRDVLAAPAGKAAEVMGWPLFFLFTIGAALPALLLLPFFAPWQADFPRPGSDG